jgi:hypothetical protein
MMAGAAESNNMLLLKLKVLHFEDKLSKEKKKSKIVAFKLTCTASEQGYREMDCHWLVQLKNSTPEI